jgi:hypothetical protein
MIIKISVVSRYQPMAHVIKTFALRCGVIECPFICWRTLGVVVIVDMLIFGAVRRKGFSFQLPLANRLPCVICVRYTYQQIAYQPHDHLTVAIFQHFFPSGPPVLQGRGYNTTKLATRIVGACGT